MSRIRVFVNGAAGRMGSACCRWIEEEADLRLVGRGEKGDDLERLLREADAEVAVDFTPAATRMATASAIVEAGARPVIGTSGYLPEDIETLRDLCALRRVGGLVAPNFSLGAVLMMGLARKAAALLPKVEIVETHHERKADKPSGTALATARLLEEARRAGGGKDLPPIPVHSLRIPGVHSRQEVLFGGRDETLSIRHEAISPEAFRDGVLLGIRRAPALDRLVFGLGELLGLG